MINAEKGMEEALQNSPQQNKIYDRIDPNKGKDFNFDFIAKEKNPIEQGGYQPKYVKKIQDLRNKINEISGSDQSPDDKNMLIKNEKIRLAEPAIARMKMHIEQDPKIVKRNLSISNIEDHYDAIVNVLAATGETGRHLEELNELRKKWLKINPDLNI